MLQTAICASKKGQLLSIETDHAADAFKPKYAREHVERESIWKAAHTCFLIVRLDHVRGYLCWPIVIDCTCECVYVRVCEPSCACVRAGACTRVCGAALRSSISDSLLISPVLLDDQVDRNTCDET